MRNLSVLDVQKVLANLRNNHGVDLSHPHGMANLHGKMYPTIGTAMSFYDKDAAGNERDTVSTEWHVPLENTHVIVGHTSEYNGNPNTSGPMYNVMIPGTFRDHPNQGGARHWSLSYPRDDARGDRHRIGPVYATGVPGILDTHGRDTVPFDLLGGHFHDLVGHVSKLPRPRGLHVDYYSSPGEAPFSDEDMANFKLRDAIGTQIRLGVAMDFPKGADNLISIQHFKSREHPSDFYLYDPGTEQLLPSRHAKQLDHWYDK